MNEDDVRTPADPKADPQLAASSRWSTGQRAKDAWAPRVGTKRRSEPPASTLKTCATVIAIGVVGLVSLTALTFVVETGIESLLGRQIQMDAADIPHRIETDLPCEKSCKVTSITLHDRTWIVVVASDDDRQWLSYELGPNHTQPQPPVTSPVAKVYFDHRAIDWTIASTLKEELERRAEHGRGVTSIHVSPCNFAATALPARACMRAEVLTASGEVTRIVDASTGELVSERY